MVYQFREGARVKGVEAQVVGEEIARILERDGKLETTTIVDEARPKNAPLHPAFEWDNSIAGEQWRLQQARQLAKSTEVVKEGEEPIPQLVHVRAVSSEEPGYYQNTMVAIKNPDEWAMVLQELRGKVAGVVKSVEVLERLAERKPRKTRALVKKAGAAVDSAKAVIDEIAE